MWKKYFDLDLIFGFIQILTSLGVIGVWILLILYSIN